MPAGPKFIRFFWPLLTALSELGGAAKPREVIDLVLDTLAIPDDERTERTKSGSLRVENQVHWARWCGPGFSMATRGGARGTGTGALRRGRTAAHPSSSLSSRSAPWRDW